MRNIFKNPQRQAEFDEQGCTVLSFLDAPQIQRLSEFYGTLNNDHIPAYGFHYSLDNMDGRFVERVADAVRENVAASVDEHFDRCKVIVASFVVKEPNPKSLVPPHQDWTFVDETEFDSVSVWAPLVDVQMENGALGVIRGSHKFFSHIRPSPAPQFRPPFGDHMFSIFPYLGIIPLKAGEAVVFNNKTIHASPPNASPTPRVAVGFVITQAEADLYHHYLLPGHATPRIETYAVDETFFYAYNNTKLRALHEQGTKPEGFKSVGVSDLGVQPITADALVDMFKKAGNTMNLPLIEQLARLFNYSLDGRPIARPS
jgi:hypothetical protein